MNDLTAARPASSSSDRLRRAYGREGLAGAPFDVTVVDQHNYHLFRRYSISGDGGALARGHRLADRGILRRQDNVNVILAKVSGVDTTRRK